MIHTGWHNCECMCLLLGCRVQHSSGHFAGLCSSSEASWGVPKLIRLQQRRGTILRGQTSSWNLLTLIIKSFSPLKQLHQGHRS
nr:hypothetical protein CFP56_46997 [Quercus suber]